MINRGKKLYGNVIVLIVILHLFVPLISSAESSLGTFKQNDCVNLIQICEDCSYNNISSVTYPDSTIAISNVQLTKNDTLYNYTFCSTGKIGEYLVNGYGDLGGTKTVWAYNFLISASGDNVNSTQGLLLLAQMGVVGLFFGLGRVFSKDKWKIKGFFDLSALLMGVILLNSIRIVTAQSPNLNTMGNMGLILGIVILSFLFLYIFINALIQVFSYFKDRKSMRWEVSNNP